MQLPVYLAHFGSLTSSTGSFIRNGSWNSQTQSTCSADVAVYK
jgi:hypothetical protein